MRRIALGIAILGSLAVASSADARPQASETITANLSFPTFPSSAPFTGTYSGTFTASGTVSDSGTVTAVARFGAVPAPSTGVLETTRTLTGAQGTLTLAAHRSRRTSRIRTQSRTRAHAR
jgi:hypothetical protein